MADPPKLEDEDPWLALAQLRWPNGFSCPHCEHTAATRLSTRPSVMQCRRCRRQTSVTAGTALHRSRLGPERILRALELVVALGPSARFLERTFDVSYETAWALLQKIRRALQQQPHIAGEVHASAERWDDADAHLPRALRDRGSPVTVALACELGGGAIAASATEAPPVVIAELLERSSGLVALDSSIIPAGARLVVPPTPRVRALLRASGRRAHLLLGQLRTWLARTFLGVSRKYLRRYIDEALARRNGVPIGERVFAAPFASLRALRTAP